MLGTDFSDYFTDPAKAEAGYQEVFREGRVRDYELAVRHRDGGVTPVLYNASVYCDEAGQVIGVFAAARDITERVLAYQLLEQRVEERTRELATLLTISHNMASTLELEPLLNFILDQLKVMVDYTSVSILMLDRDDLVVTEYRGPYPRAKVLHSRFPVEGAVGGREVVSRREPVIIADMEDDSPLAQAYRDSASEEQKRVASDARSWMGVPLIVKDQAIGMLRLCHSQPNYFAPRHAQLALAIANQAAVAIENAQLYERAHQLAAMEERQRLARELHDSVSQALYGIALGTHTALTMRDRDPAKLTEALNYVLSLADAGLTEMRALIFELRPESLEQEGLVAALQKQAASIRARHDIMVKAELCEEPNVRLEVKEALYRIAQEALHNTAKHARASQAELVLSCSADALVLVLADNGIGFDPSASFAGHLGLRSMRERVARLDGAVEIESAPGQGTHIRARIPLHAA
jgi:signal transduction histidine kinase